MKNDVFGKEGDFTTSPEISQMFGEVSMWDEIKCFVDCSISMNHDGGLLMWFKCESMDPITTNACVTLGEIKGLS